MVLRPSAVTSSVLSVFIGDFNCLSIRTDYVALTQNVTHETGWKSGNSHRLGAVLHVFKDANSPLGEGRNTDTRDRGCLSVGE